MGQRRPAYRSGSGVGSKVTIRDTANLALRAVNDIFAPIKDDRLPDEIRRASCPACSVWRWNQAAQQAYYEAVHGGPGSVRVRGRLDDGEEDHLRLALAVHGDPGADVNGWRRQTRTSPTLPV
jgi:hypothetical protein